MSEETVERIYSDAAAIGAVRLALEASADARILRRVLREIVERTRPTDPWNTASVALFIDAIRAAGGRWEVTDERQAIVREASRV